MWLRRWLIERRRQREQVGRDSRVARQLRVLDNFGDPVKTEMHRLRREFLYDLITDAYAAYHTPHGPGEAEGR